MAQGGNEAFSRVIIDALLADVGWNLTDGRSVRYEYPLANGTRADYVLSDRHGRALAVVEAKRISMNRAAVFGSHWRSATCGPRESRGARDRESHTTSESRVRRSLPSSPVAPGCLLVFALFRSRGID